MKATKEQIAAWKKKHGEVFLVTVEDKTAYLHKPDRKTIAYAMSKVQDDPLSFSEIILQNCWLTGDEELKTNDDYFLAVSAQLDKLVEVKQAEIKKL